MHPRDRPFRFSASLGAVHGRTELIDRVRMIEGLGYSTVTIADHLNDQLGPLTAMATIAEHTTTLRVGALVFCNDFRHPVTLAKEAATLDLLTEGRFEFGLGAGWKIEDYRWAGIPLDGAGRRVERLGEALEVIRSLWSDEVTDHRGEHYRVDAMPGTPRPFTPGGPPITVGGGGRRVLELAARHADVVGLNPQLASGVIDASAGPTSTPTATTAKIEWIHGAAGDRLDDIEIHSRWHLAAVVPNRGEIAEELAPAFGLTPEEALDSPHAAVGTVGEICENLRRQKETWGVSYLGVPATAVEEMAPVVAELSGAT